MFKSNDRNYYKAQQQGQKPEDRRDPSRTNPGTSRTNPINPNKQGGLGDKGRTTGGIGGTGTEGTRPGNPRRS